LIKEITMNSAPLSTLTAQLMNGRGEAGYHRLVVESLRLIRALDASRGANIRYFDS
jgi:hypothetical protein